MMSLLRFFEDYVEQNFVWEVPSTRFDGPARVGFVGDLRDVGEDPVWGVLYGSDLCFKFVSSADLLEEVRVSGIDAEQLEMKIRISMSALAEESMVMGRPPTHSWGGFARI